MATNWIKQVSPEEAKEILLNSPWRELFETIGGHTRPQIQHEGEWWDMCRTDLYDDIVTSRYHWKTGEQYTKEDYINSAIHGGRFYKWHQGRIFAVIDSLSDG